MTFSTYPGPRTTLRPTEDSSASSRDRTAPLSDDWIRFRVTFVNALRDFPDAYEAVVAALRLCRTTYHLPDPPLP
jgi:hypothetical protein